MLLEPDEPPAFEVVNATGRSPLVLLCDHASRRVPRALGDLGLSAERLREHIAWDIGAADVARSLCRTLDAPLVLAGYSRLVVDANRPLSVASSVPAVTCDIAVPGNAALSEAQRLARQQQVFWPYHRAIEELLAARDARGACSVIFSVHSFTPSLHGKHRPWHLGVMYGTDRRLAAQLLASLAADDALVIGDNQPYRVTDATDYGIPTYAERAGRLGVLLEIRQDLIDSPSGVERYAAILARSLAHVVVPPPAGSSSSGSGCTQGN